MELQQSLSIKKQAEQEHVPKWMIILEEILKKSKKEMEDVRD